MSIIQKISFRLFVSFAALLASTTLAAQPALRMVTVVVTPDHPDWLYRVGEPVTFTITASQNGLPLSNGTVHYEAGPEKMKPTTAADAPLKDGKLVVKGGTLSTPGFLRCVATVTVDSTTYRGLATAGFNPEGIKAAAQLPADFTKFWDDAKAAAARVPMDARMTLLPERCTEKVNVYHVNLQNYAVNTRLYGILCVPKAEGKYPAVLRVPGAGVRPYGGYIEAAENGIISFEIGIHGIPVTLDPALYTSLASGGLRNYMFTGASNRDQFYYKRVYLGCVRANDFIFSLPQFDGANLAVTGGSQGGALSIVTAALDPRVKCLGAFYPALSDIPGYLQQRAGGWPHYFSSNPNSPSPSKEVLEATAYYDVVNFARQLKVPGYYSWGFNDETCPPTSLYAAYNNIAAPKQLLLALDTGHWTYPEQNKKMADWIAAQLKKR